MGRSSSGTSTSTGMGLSGRHAPRAAATHFRSVTQPLTTKGTQKDNAAKINFQFRDLNLSVKAGAALFGTTFSVLLVVSLHDVHVNHAGDCQPVQPHNTERPTSLRTSP
jgi:hypothetical protein